MTFALTSPPADARTLDEFLGWMVDRYCQRAQVDEAFALESAKAQVDEQGAEFGDPAYGWTRADAHELADQDMECWEE